MVDEWGVGFCFLSSGVERGKFWVRGKGCASQGAEERGRKPALHPFRPQIKGRKLGRQRVNRRPAEEELGEQGLGWGAERGRKEAALRDALSGKAPGAAAARGSSATICLSPRGAWASLGTVGPALPPGAPRLITEASAVTLSK